MLKGAQLHSVFTNTETLLTTKSEKPPSQQRHIHEGIKQHNC